MNLVFTILFYLCVNLAAPSHAKSETSEKNLPHDHQEHRSGENHEVPTNAIDGEKQNLPSGITKFVDGSGFSLSQQAEKNFGILTQPLVGIQSFIVPQSAIIVSMDKRYVYLFLDKMYVLTEVEEVKEDGNNTLIKFIKPYSESKIVISGSNFLKTIEMSLEEGPSEGHSH